MNSKLPHDWQISDKKNHIFQKSKSYEISSTDIYIGEDCKRNVRLAAQVLSCVSKVLLAYNPPEASETARFCSLMV